MSNTSRVCVHGLIGEGLFSQTYFTVLASLLTICIFVLLCNVVVVVVIDYLDITYTTTLQVKSECSKLLVVRLY